MPGASAVSVAYGVTSSWALEIFVAASLNRLNELVLGKRGVTADTALRLALS